ncbi:AMP-binding protein [Paucilactobacillus kaifaensis]|uniref:AMP-binding protein n=1 Tax=Paucilactobacillus kaifaensis TaxID=2559921 RepID=UPI0010F6EFF9|nr:AMP-binding protein [Paucilactobacillus kaifaensis]
MTKLTEQSTDQLIKSYERPMIKDEHLKEWFSGKQLIKDVAVLRQYFINLRIQKGDVVLVCLDNSAAYPVLMQALWEIGAIGHLVAATTPLAQLQADFNEHDYALLIAKDELAKGIVNDVVLERTTVRLHTASNLAVFVNSAITNNRSFESLVAPQEDDLALILNTSGTTGKPKRVGLTHQQLFNAAEHNITSHRLTSADTTMVVMPLSHINAQVIACLSTRLSGGKMVITKKFSASHFWQQISDNGVTWVSAVPTIVSILLMNEQSKMIYTQLRDTINLRFIRSASFSLPENKLLDFEQQFHTRVLEGYGMTETAGQNTLNPFDAPKVGSVGKAVGTQVAILVDDQVQTSDTQFGEIMLRGDHVITDYVDSHPDSFRDGWLLTGDLGYLDKDNYLFIKGRSRDMINHGGEKVAPAQVESVLSQLNLVKDVAVIGLPNELYGEAVVAVIISNTPTVNEFTQMKAVVNFAKTNLASFERPTQVYFVDEFPRNQTGKVLRNDLKQQLLQSLVGEGA